jgi:hypothetical protein
LVIHGQALAVAPGFEPGMAKSKPAPSSHAHKLPQRCRAPAGELQIARIPQVTFSLTWVLVSATLLNESRSVKDAFGRGYSRRWSECGARAWSDTLRSRAASGIMLTGTTTGPGGAFPGLGQAGAGNARVRAQDLCSPVGATVPDRTSCHVPGSLAWSCAQGPKALTVRAVVERR